MRVLITGANGFVGRLLAKRLLEQGHLCDRPLSALLLLDQHFESQPVDERLRYHTGSITDAALLRRMLADGVDVVFHLISIPGGAAEQDYELGYHVNLQGTLELFDQLRQLEPAPVVVYASSVAVFGAPLPSTIDEHTPVRPVLSYGAHKAMAEIALQDLSRRGVLDGRAVRLPGIVARPRQPNGLRSAFMSDLLWALAAGEPYTCPVSPEAVAWWMSASRCVDNLLTAAELDADRLIDSRVCTLPVLRLSIAQMVEALAIRFGEDRRALVSYEPDEALEAVFGRFPPLRTTQAKALGFRHDGSAATLIRHALSLPHSRPVAAVA
jgi:nucleoside-diphosphate-sugar epimerase